MNEGLQILLLDFLFQRYMTGTQNFVQRIKLLFWWLAPENPKNHFFTQKLA